MITVAPDFAPASVCRELVGCFERHIPALGMVDGQATFSHRVLRLRQLSCVVASDDRSVRQMRVLRWLATEHLRDFYRDLHIHPEETQLVRWSAGDGQNLHLDSTRPTTTHAAILYLNDGFVGGETFFEGGPTIIPRRGTLVGFPGPSLRHGVRTVVSGVRLTMPMWFTNQDAFAEP